MTIRQPVHHKGKFWNRVHLETQPANPELALCCSLEPELRHGIIDLLSGLKEKIHQKSLVQGTQGTLEQFQLCPAESRWGLHLLQPAHRNAMLPIYLRVLGVVMRIYMGVFPPSPGCSQHAVNSKLCPQHHSMLGENWSQCLEISWKVCRAAARQAHFSQLIKSLKSIFIKSIEGNPRISGRRGEGVVMEKNPLLNQTETSKRGSAEAR